MKFNSQCAIRVGVYPAADQSLASSRIRVFRLLSHMTRLGLDVTLSAHPDKCDVIIMQKRYDEHLLKSQAVRILDLDDDMLNYGPYIEQSRRAAKLASAVVVSTRKLAEQARIYNPNVYVVPTGVDLDVLTEVDIRPRVKKVCWVGYPENLKYLDELLPVLSSLKLKLRVITRRVDVVDNLIRQYPETVEFCPWDLETVDRAIQECDLGIAPLDSDDWSQAKSANKILKYWGLGLPVICGSSPAHEEIEQQLGDSVIANSAADWTAMLVMGQERRFAQVKKARMLLEGFLPGKLASLWEDIVRTEFERCKRKTSPETKQINTQRGGDSGRVKNRSRPLRVVHLCTHDSGGAGKAAYRLHRSLKGAGVESTMLVLVKSCDDPDVLSLEAMAGVPASELWRQQVYRWNAGLQRYPGRPAGLEMFSDATSSILLEDIPAIREADIIQLHWIAGLVDFERMPRAFRGKKVVWRMPDLHAFTGGCHYSSGCDRYMERCGACPQLGSNKERDWAREIFDAKARAYAATDITLVGPSAWVAARARESELGRSCEVRVINNSLPIDVFKPVAQDEARSQLGLPLDRQIVLFGADDIANQRKGFRFLIDALKMPTALETGDIALVCFGNIDNSVSLPEQLAVHSLGRIKDESTIALIYSAADVFVLPSLEDNFPGTVLEALACGTPVAAFSSGGVPEMVRDGFTGYLAEPGDVKGLAAAIGRVLNERDVLAPICRQEVLRKYAPKVQSTAYLALYTELAAAAGYATALNQEGEECAERGDIRQAKWNLCEALRFAPADAELLTNMGAVLWAENDQQGALEYLLTAFRIHPDSLPVVTNLSQVLLAQGRYTDAERIIQSHLKRHPRESDLQDLLRSSVLDINDKGEALFKKGDLQAAEAKFLQAIEQDTGYVDGYNNLGVLCWTKGDIAKALECFAAGLRLDPDHRDLIVNTAEILKILDKPDDVAALYEGYLARNPADSSIRCMLEDLDTQPLEQTSIGITCESEGKLAVKLVDHSIGGKAPRISVVIPSFNQGKFLEETICSILDQLYPNLELIIIDGGSTDQSIDIIRKYEGNISYWKSSSDRGQYWAVEAGLHRSTGDIMTWINSDDKLHPNSLNAIASIFTQLKEVDWVTGTPNIMNEKGQLAWVCSNPPVYGREYYLAKKYDYPNYIQQEGTFWRRSLWEKAGGRLKTKLKMAGDLELWMRFFRHSRLYTTDMLLGCFRQHSGQKTDGGLELYRKEAITELDKEIKRFKKSSQTLPEKAPVILIADESMISLNSERIEEGTKAAPESCDEILLTAIVSTYNSERYIEGCLQDLMSQTIAHRLEVIIVDSGSQQNERALVERYQKRYANIRYFRTDERESIYGAWNRAIAEARGKYLTNANTDDRHRIDAYQRMATELEVNPDVSLVYADSAVTRTPNTGFDQAPVEGFLRWPEFDARHLFSVCYIGPQPMWRRSLHEKYGNFDAQMKVAGDYDFWLRMATAESFRHIPEVLGLYLMSSGSLEHAFAAEAAHESEAARQRNWPDDWGQRPALSPGYLVRADQVTEYRSGDQAQAPLVSIIMPTKDRLKLLGRALDSVIAQTYRNWELIVVNDGGESIRTVIGGRDPSDRIRRIEIDRSQAQAVARNTALAVARGEIICYLDDDDVYLPHHLATIVRELSGQGRAFIYTDAVVVKERLVDGRGEEVDRSKPHAHHEYSRQRLLVNNYIPINTWAHKRACLDAIGMFDSSLSCYEDWEFLLRLSERYDFHHIKQTTVEVRHRVDQVDNVSRKRLADTADAYRTIYARHGKGLGDDLLAERENVVQALIRNIDAWTSAGKDCVTSGAATAPGSDSASAQAAAENSYQKWMTRHKLSDRDIARISKHMMTDWTIQPSVHLIMTHRSGQEEALADTLDSISSQLYGGWGLSVVSCSPCPDSSFEEMDMLEWRQVEGNLMQGVDAVVMESAADWIGLLDAGSTLEAHLLFRFVDFINQHPEWRLVYMDEDRIGDGGGRYSPLFKPEFNLELLRTMPYLGRFLLLEREALVAAGGYSRQPGTEAYDIVFRLVEQSGREAIGHIPDVLIHQQDRFHLAQDEQVISEHRRQCIEAHLQRCAIAADVQPGAVSGSYFVDYACDDKPAVDIIVPVSGGPESLGLFLDRLSTMTDYPGFRVRLLVRDDVKLSAEFLSSQCGEVSTYSKKESQWQKLLELVRESDGEYVLLLSPGCIAIQSNWLERLVAHMHNDDVAVVAPRLISADKKIVGGGYILGAGPCSIGMVAYGGLSLEDPGYMGRAQVAQDMSAVSTSCMLVRKSVFESVGGLSEDLKIPLYQAVDYCLRVREAGGRIIWTPHSTLLSLGEDQTAQDGVDTDEAVTRDSETVCRRALAALASDPGYNPNLKLAGKRFSVDDSFAPQLTHDNDSLHRVVGLGVGSIGSWQFRIQQPLQAMQGEGRANSLILPYSKDIVPLPSMAELERLQVDSLLMHNTMHSAYMDAMEAYKRVNQTFVVFGQDDLMYAMPPKNPFSKTIYKDVKKRVRRCLGIADRVIVTTQALADELRTMADDIRVLPNYLDEAIWRGLQSQRGVAQKPRVGWAGAQQHLGDLELLEEVVRETADEVDWVFFGMCPEFLQPYAKEIHNPVTFAQYPQKLAMLNLDIAVAPLERNRFNECKSNLRLLEYGALGWPVIASDIAPYGEGPVCRVPNQARAWIKAIRERSHDLDASRQEGDVLRDWVRDNWLLQQHLDDWLLALNPASDCRQRHSTQGRAAGL